MLLGARRRVGSVRNRFLVRVRVVCARLKSPQLYRLSYQPKVDGLINLFVSVGQLLIFVWPTFWPIPLSWCQLGGLGDGLVEGGE
jgi:hypothetical protein